MCGRFLMNEEAVEAVSEFARIPEAIQGHFDLGMIFPSNPSIIIWDDDGGFSCTVKKFGYFYEKMKKRIINARAETVTEKWMFRQAFQKQRCLIPCALFYEWDAQKQRISFFENGQRVLYLAGFWMEDGFVILTTQANASVAPYHHRMPLVLDQKQASDWLTSTDEAARLLKLIPPQLDHRFQYENLTLF